MRASKKLIATLLIVAVGLVLFIWVTKNYKEANRLPKATPTPTALYLDRTQSIEDRVSDLLSYMTLEEKIGQMTLIEKNSISQLSDIKLYHLGGLLSGAGAKPEDNTKEGWFKMIDEYQTEASLSRLGIPLLYGVDAVHGHAHVPGATVFPHAISLGATQNQDLVKAVARATAEELVQTGVNWSYSPNLDQPQDIRWGRVYEAFSDDPVLVSKLGVSYLQGLQESSNQDDSSLYVLGTLKHYIGLGSMEWNTSKNKNFYLDQGVTADDISKLRSTYLPPFTAAIDAGALSIMAGLNTWGEKRIVQQKYLLSDVLKNELSFKGFVVSDWYGIHEGQSNKFLATIQAINAGVDMVMLPFDYVTFMNHMKLAHALGFVSDERVDDAVSRILYAKFALGLFDKKIDGVGLFGIENKTHQKLAYDAAVQSLVLLKNEGSVLPLSPYNTHIRVAGSAADNVGIQTGAWTIEWQGIDGNWLPGAISILEGIKNNISQGTKLEYDLLGKFSTTSTKASVGIAVVGEKPYAEGWGDRANPVLSNEDLQAIKNLQASCEKVIVVIISGRPLLIANEVESFDALVAAWLPGGRGDAVGDTIFGKKTFSGKLPLPWPNTTEQLPIATDGTTADGTPVLYPRYFGLTL